MSCPLSPFDIARAWAQAFMADKNLAHWAVANYGRAFAVQIGADMRRPPAAEDAPFITIFADSSATGPQRNTASSSLSLVIGLDDDKWVEAGGAKELRGLLRLNELCPLVEAAMRLALPRARVQELETDFEILEYPLCMALITATVEEGLPIGRR